MKKVKFHFYGINNLGSIFIAARLASRITHCSVEFEPIPTQNALFHSTVIGGCQRTDKCTMPIPIETIEIEVDNLQYDKMLLKAKSMLGQRYDMKAVLGFIFVTHFENSKASFCSEFCNEVFSAAFYNPIKRRTLITPSEFRSYIEGFRLGTTSR